MRGETAVYQPAGGAPPPPQSLTERGEDGLLLDGMASPIVIVLAQRTRCSCHGHVLLRLTEAVAPPAERWK